MMTYLHVAYICGKPDCNDTLWGDTIIRFDEGVRIENIREWLQDDIKEKKGEGWNLPTLIDFQVLDEKLALQLAPELIKDIHNKDYDRGYAAGIKEGKRLGRIETLDSMPKWNYFSNNYHAGKPTLSTTPETGKTTLEVGCRWIYVDDLRQLEVND